MTTLAHFEQCISPQLIIMRVVTGAAWTKQGTTEISALEFQTLGSSAGPATTATITASQSEVPDTEDHKSVEEQV